MNDLSKNIDVCRIAVLEDTIERRRKRRDKYTEEKQTIKLYPIVEREDCERFLNRHIENLDQGIKELNKQLKLEKMKQYL